jgi:uncharacterized protein YdeI (YjbR/CyaY-like superfamily)
VDEYIAKSAAFAQPVLKHIRQVVHEVCPEVEETIKWGFPHFMYNGILCSMASFKQHCAFGFWKASLMKDANKMMTGVGETSMGHFGKLNSLADLPSDKILTAYIKEAAALNREGAKTFKKKPAPKKDLVVPAYFTTALAKNKEAKKVFEEFTYSQRKDYVEWVTEAKTEETRSKRLASTVQWLSEGKTRNWKYESK